MAKESKSYQKRRWQHSRVVLATAVLMGAVVVVVGMAVWTGRAPQDRTHRVPVGELPAFAASAPSRVQGAYLYAAGHPEVLRYIPCYCWCRHQGHLHNGDCYVHARHSDGTITFTSHAAT